jgi:peptidyl-prolyl cis-trans isomerase SurA
MYGLRLRLLFAALFAACTPLAGLAQVTPLQSMDRIVAIVEEDVILDTELDKRVKMVTQQFTAAGQQLPQPDVVRSQVLETLILERLQLQKAAQTGIRVTDTEVNDAIDTVAQQNGLTMEQLQEALRQDGFELRDYRQTVRDEIATQRLRQRLVSSQVQVTDNEIDLLLAKQASQGSAQVHLAHLLISVPQNATQADVDEAEQEAIGIYQQLLEGLSFAEAAITYSDDQYALNGGELGWRPIDQVPTLFARQVQTMNPGDVSQPVRSPAGWHIVKVIDNKSDQAAMVAQVEVRHILVRPSELVTDAEAEQTIRDLYARIVGGEDFAALAREYSDDEYSAPNGGSLGWIEPGAYGPQIQQLVTSMEPGQVAPPFQSQAGWHVFRMDDRREVDKAEEQQRNQVRDTIFARKAEETYELWLRQIRDEAYVETRLES